MVRRARPCGGVRCRGEAGETVGRHEMPCGGRQDPAEAGEAVRRQHPVANAAAAAAAETAVRRWRWCVSCSCGGGSRRRGGRCGWVPGAVVAAAAAAGAAGCSAAAAGRRRQLQRKRQRCFSKFCLAAILRLSTVSNVPHKFASRLDSDSLPEVYLSETIAKFCHIRKFSHLYKICWFYFGIGQF